MDLPFFYLNLSKTELCWRNFFHERFEMYFKEVLIHKDEYDKIKRFLEYWISFCIQERQNENDYEEFEINFNFANYKVRAFLVLS